MIEKYLLEQILIPLLLSRLTEDVTSADIDSEIHLTRIKDFKNYGKWFLFHLKSSNSSSQDFSFSFFDPPFHSFQVQRVR